MKAIVNEETCIGCALCSGIADDIFEMNYDIGKAVVKINAMIGPDNIERAKEAEQNCPVGAIKITE